MLALAPAGALALQPMKSGVAVSCVVDDENAQARFAISSTGEARVTISEAKAKPAHECELELERVRDLSEAQVPSTLFMMKRVKACEPRLTEPLLSGLRHELKLELDEPGRKVARVFLLYSRKASVCRIEKLKKVDLDLLIGRLATKKELVIRAFRPEEPRPSPAKK